jgi:glycosyltransferase involved in cell wall biosynthesis
MSAMSLDPTNKERKSRSVLMIVENLPVPFDRRVWQEASALRQAGYDVAIICPKGKGQDASYELIEGIHIYRHFLIEASSGFGFALEYATALFWQLVLSIKIARYHKFSVIHGCNPPDLIFLISLFHRILSGSKFLFDHHDLCPELYEAKFGRQGVALKILKFAERLTFRCADASLATNEGFRDIAVQRGGMPPDRVHAVKSYPDLKRFRRTQPDAEIKGRWPFLIGYVGIMASQDGVDRLVKAMAHIVRTRGRNDIGCLIIGDGPELMNLKALAANLDLAQSVIFTGYLTGEKLLSYLCALDVGVIPDPPNCYNDKISMNKVFEYMTLGLPFVHFDLAQCRREAGDAALMAESDSPESLAEAVLTLLADPERREKMSAYGRTRASREFQWDNEVNSLLAAYDSLFCSKSGDGMQG